MLDVLKKFQPVPGCHRDATGAPGHSGSVLVVSCTAHGHGSVSFVGGSGDLVPKWLEKGGKTGR